MSHQAASAASTTPAHAYEADRLSRVATEIRALLPKTSALFESAHEVVPGGFTRARFFWPLPIYIDRGEGPFVWDVDGRRYIDCMLGFGAMVLGHCDPGITSAVQSQLEKGCHFGTAVATESELARLIVDNVPGAEQVIFVNSGTEATLAALRIARAATGRPKIAKFEGGWHGWHDYLIQSFSDPAGPEQEPTTVPNSLGIPPAVGREVVTLPYNHEAAFDLIRQHAGELAGVIFEAVQGSAGCIVADPDWARELQRVCNAEGVTFICDEVITGFRLGPHGAAGVMGLEADLTTLGKAIGGGFPVGAITGRADLVGLIQPHDATEEHVLMAGTFSANPVTMVAGKAQLSDLLADTDAYRRLNALGARMRAGLTDVLREAGLRGQLTGTGSLWGLHLGAPTAPRNVRDSLGFHEPAGHALAGYLLREGVLMEVPVYLGFVSTRHTEALVDEVVDAHRRALARMRADGLTSHLEL